MELEQMVIGILVIGIITTGIVMTVGGFAHIANKPVDTAFSSSYDKITETMLRVNQTENKLFEGGINPAFSLLPIATSLLSIGSILLNSLGTIQQMLQSLSDTLGVPAIIVQALTGICTIMFIFALVRLIAGRIQS